MGIRVNMRRAKMIGIIDYKAGNSHSVFNACERIGTPCKMISKQDDFKQIDGIILPGVGSAEATMESLRELEIIDCLEEHVLVNKVPFLGICVGLQVLFEHSEEGDVECLGWLKGKVVKFEKGQVRVPQIGWNKVENLYEDMIFNELEGEKYLYFVNSYYAIPEDKDDLLAVSEYGQRFTAMVKRENIYASQCHIEKSGEVGLRILKNFCQLNSNRSGGDAYVG